MLSNTAKHFTCYSALIGAVLFLFGLYHKADLQYTASQQKVVDSATVVIQANQNAQKAIADRDAQLQVVNARLDKAQADAKTLSQQVDLVNKFLSTSATPNNELKIHVPDSGDSRPNPSTDSSQTVVIPAEAFAGLTRQVVACEKCQNSLAVAQKDVDDLKQRNEAQVSLISAYQFTESKQPHTKFQKFRKGVRWVFLLGH